MKFRDYFTQKMKEITEAQIEHDYHKAFMVLLDVAYKMLDQIDPEKEVK